jgi:hypothetical protein
LQDWQTEELGSDGQSELVALMSILPTGVRLEAQARLEAAFEQTRPARQLRSWPPLPLGIEEPPAPLSGVRRTQIGAHANGQ